MPGGPHMTTVQVPRAFVARLPRLLIHRRQPFYEVLDLALRLVEARTGDEPP